MKGITAVGCAVIVALVACSLSSAEAKTDKLLVPAPQAEKSELLEKSQGNSPAEAELTKSVAESEQNKNTGLRDELSSSSVGQVRHILKKRDEISDYEGWENKKRK